MFLTANKLKIYGACEEGVAFFAKHFPDGAELIDIMKIPFIPHSFLHWGWLHLNTNDEERAMYEKVLEIQYSSGVFQSEKVYKSNDIVLSKDVKLSNYVYNGQKIDQSHFISDSMNITNSQQVGMSNTINKSLDIMYSQNLEDCAHVGKSSFCTGSRNIWNSSMIVDSTEITDSRSLKNCTCIGSCEQLDHCMFCYELSNKEYHIFNKPIDPTIFKMIYDCYYCFTIGDFAITTNWENNWQNHTSVYLSPATHFRPILDDEYLLKWIKTIPNFSEELLYNITFDSRSFNL